MTEDWPIWHKHAELYPTNADHKWLASVFPYKYAGQGGW
jgi:hypothetical protein